MKKKIVLGSCISLFLSLSHAAEIGTLTVNDDNFHQVTYQVAGDYAIAEGDIIVAKISDLNIKSAVIIPKIGGARWTDGIVPFEVDEMMPIHNKLAIYQAIGTWQKTTNLEFVELTSKNRYDYRDFISFIPSAGTTCSSHVGKQGGKQVINLAPRCTHMNTVHEIGHALGLWHEQSRADRNQYIRIVWENIEPDHKHNFDQHLTDGKDFGEYDYESIMHYGEYAFSKNGEKTIIPIQDDVAIGQRDKLSAKDIAVINTMYPNT